MIKIKFANLINIIAKEKIIPELLQYKCNPKDLSKMAIKLLEDQNLCQKQINNSQKSLIAMGLNFKDSPAQLAAKYIIKYAI
jgi:lipid-A-disaccharide synthase